MVFDAHADILTHIHECKKVGMTNIFKTKHLEHFKKGKIKAGIFVIWIDPHTIEDSREELINTMANVSNEILENKDILKIIKSGDELKFDKSSEKVQMIMGIEGLKCIENQLELIDMLYIYGIRHMSLTWNEENLIGTGVGGDPNRGLTEYGIEVIKKLESLNMIIDISHANEKTFWDIMTHTKGIVIASHSNSRTICDHKRNLKDEQLKAIANRGGVVGINVHKNFVSNDKCNQNIEKLIDHIDYLRDIIGVDYIGFGLDFCEYLEGSGYENTEGLNNASDTQKIIVSLQKRGYTEGDIEKISYKNFYRVVQEVLK